MKFINRIDKVFYKIDREEKWKDQKGKCYYCDTPITKDELTFDHVIPIKKVKFHTSNNCVVSCSSCNQDKGHKDLEEWKSSEPKDLEHWEKMIVDWDRRMKENIRRFEFSWENDTKGGYQKWRKYWMKRGRWA